MNGGIGKAGKLPLSRNAGETPLSCVLKLGFVPQFVGDDALWSIGAVQREERAGMMLRTICLSAEEMDQISAAYVSGAATFWRGDGF